MLDKTNYFKPIILSINPNEGYGSNDNWIDFCERNQLFSTDIMKNIIDMFLQYFNDDIRELKILWIMKQDIWI